MLYLGEKSLGSGPVDLYVFELAWALNKSPDEVRQWSMRDTAWMVTVSEAKRLAQEEKRTRAKPSDD